MSKTQRLNRKQRFYESISKVKIRLDTFVYHRFSIGRYWYVRALIKGQFAKDFAKVNGVPMSDPSALVGLGDRIVIKEDGILRCETVSWDDLHDLFDK